MSQTINYKYTKYAYSIAILNTKYKKTDANHDKHNYLGD